MRVVGTYERVGADIKRACASVERRNGGPDILGSLDFQSGDIEAEGAGCSLHPIHFQHGSWITGIPHDRQSAKTGDDLAQEFDPFSGKLGRLNRQSSDVAAWPRQAGDEAGAERVVGDRKDDRDDRCRLLCSSDCASDRDDDIDLAPDELSGDLGIALAPSLRPAVLDRDGVALIPAKFTKPLHERGDPTAPIGRSARP
jgi:hypothetical protein